MWSGRTSQTSKKDDSNAIARRYRLPPRLELSRRLFTCVCLDGMKAKYGEIRMRKKASERRLFCLKLDSTDFVE